MGQPSEKQLSKLILEHSPKTLQRGLSWKAASCRPVLSPRSPQGQVSA